MHSGPYASAFLTPDHDAAGCGAFHRNSPTGAAANGIPLNTRTPFDEVPRSCPPSTLTTSGAAPAISDAASINVAITSIRFIMSVHRTARMHKTGPDAPRASGPMTTTTTSIAYG